MKSIILLIALLGLTNIALAECNNETIININSCTVNDRIENLLVAGCEWQNGDEQTFENLICDPIVPLSFFEERLQEWKDQNIAVIVEKLRRKDIENRLKVLGVKFGNYGSVDGLRRYMLKCNYNHPNPALWVKSVFTKGNEPLLNCLESKKTEVDSDNENEETKRTEKKSLKTFIKNYDCSSISQPFLKALCRERK
jgi:hypothetical protein